MPYGVLVPDPCWLRAVTAAAQNGDELGITAFERAGTFIGQALASFLHIFNPTAVIIGGGVSRSGPLLMEPMKAAMREHVLSAHYLENMTLTTAALGDEVGLMGALALARQAQTQPDDRR